MKTLKENTTLIEKAIYKGLLFLSKEQLSTGEFKSYRSTHPEMKENCELDSSPFPSALICYCLSFSEDKSSKMMIVNAINFLKSEMTGNGVWRYWSKQHPYHKNIPPDLDDMSCISSILKKNKLFFPDNKKIFYANINSHGLFYTWITPRFRFPKNLLHWRVVLKETMKPINLYYFWKLNESNPNDIDGVVNANILNYLGENQYTVPTINYLIDIVKTNKEAHCDKWYLDKYNFYYFLSKAYYSGIKSLEPIREDCIRKILLGINPNGKTGNNILETALATCSLLNFKSNSKTIPILINTIIKKQTTSGNWNKIPMYYGGPNKYFGWGSKELTTAFCLEALIRFNNLK